LIGGLVSGGVFVGPSFEEFSGIGSSMITDFTNFVEV